MSTLRLPVGPVRGAPGVLVSTLWLPLGPVRGALGVLVSTLRAFGTAPHTCAVGTTNYGCPLGPEGDCKENVKLFVRATRSKNGTRRVLTSTPAPPARF